MMRLLLHIALGVILSTITASADSGPHITNSEVLRGRFVQERHLQGFAAPLRSEGRFVLAPGRGLIWTTEKPFGVATVITESGLIQEVNGNQTLNMSAAKLPFLSRLYRMLGGALASDWLGLEDDFILAREGDVENWQLHLTPKKAEALTMPFRAIAVKGQRFVDEVILTKPDGDHDRLTFHDQVLSSTPLTADEALTLSSVGR